MKWLDPKVLWARLLTAFVLMFAAYLLVLSIVIAVVRYWYIVLLIAAGALGIWLLSRWWRRRSERW